MSIAADSPFAPIIRSNPATFERFLLQCMTLSRRFYLSKRNYVCPTDDSGTKRPDFTSTTYNKFYGLVDALWRTYDNYQTDLDFALPKMHLLGVLTDWTNSGYFTDAEFMSLAHEIEHDIYNDGCTAPFMESVGGPGLQYWLELQVTRNAIRNLSYTQQISFATVSDIEAALDEARKSTVGFTSNYINSDEVLCASRMRMPRIPLPWSTVNRAMSGGVDWGDASMLAAISGGGKTIAICQLAAWFAIIQELNTVIVTTEVAPDQLIPRIVSNYLSIPYTQFIDRQDIPRNVRTPMMVTTIPSWIFSDPQHQGGMGILRNRIRQRLYMIDWSKGQGLAIGTDLERELDALKAIGWEPQVLLFDWIGGGLEQAKDRDQLRHIYAAGADHIGIMTRKRQMISFVTAQLDKTKVLNKPAVHMSHLSESKGMINNYPNFLGMTALEEPGDHLGSARNWALNQFLCMPKLRNGPGGKVPILYRFEYQRLEDPASQRQSAEASSHESNEAPLPPAPV